MSFNAIRWALDQQLPLVPKAVLIQLADFSDKDFKAFPTLDTLTDKCGCNRSTVIRQIKFLISAGLISEQKRWKQNGGQTSSLFTLNITKKTGSTMSDCESSLDRLTATQGGGSQPLILGSQPPRGVAHSHPSIKEDPITKTFNQSLNQSLNPQPKGECVCDLSNLNFVSEDPTPDPFEFFWEIYPRKANRTEAKKAWVATVTDDALAEVIIADVQDRSKRHYPWAKAIETGDKKYILYPAKYLTGQRWQDEFEGEHDEKNRKTTGRTTHARAMQRLDEWAEKNCVESDGDTPTIEGDYWPDNAGPLEKDDQHLRRILD